MLNVLLTSLVLTGAPVDHALSLGGAFANTDARTELGYRLRADGWQLGAHVRLGLPRVGYIAGQRAEDGLAFAGAVTGVAPLTERGPLQLSLAASVGLSRWEADRAVGGDTRATTLLTRVGPIASVRLSDTWAVRGGWLNVLDLQQRPAAGLEALGQVVTVGVAAALRDDLQLYADVEAGGLLGFDGDGTKFLARGGLGLRFLPGGGAASWTTF